MIWTALKHKMTIDNVSASLQTPGGGGKLGRKFVCRTFWAELQTWQRPRDTWARAQAPADISILEQGRTLSGPRRAVTLALNDRCPNVINGKNAPWSLLYRALITAGRGGGVVEYICMVTISVSSYLMLWLAPRYTICIRGNSKFNHQPSI